MVKYSLPNGLTVILEPIQNVVSISAGLWVKTGSRYESPEQYGYAHFVEHMLFKGTEKYSAKDIAQVIDRVGGQHNAATNREYTCYYINVVSDYLELSVELLADMYLNSLFSESDVEKERDVIIEELLMYEDSPDEHIHDVFIDVMFGNHPLAHEILGTIDTLKAVDSSKLKCFHDANYTYENTILVIAGNFDLALTKSLIQKYFPRQTLDGKCVRKIQPAEVNRTVYRKHIERELEQVHFCLGVEGIDKHDKHRWALYLLSTILGGSMSSRLFQKVREDMGLCYSIYSFHSSYSDAGVFGIYCGTSPKKYELALDLVLKELETVLKQNVSKDELRDAKAFMKGNLALSLESIEVKMGMLARDEINFKKQFTYEDIVSRIDNVTLEDFANLGRILFDNKRISLVSIGKLEKVDDRELVISV